MTSLTIHDVLNYGDIVFNDEALDVLVIYHDEDNMLAKFQGDTMGRYSLVDTLADVDDDDDAIEAGIESLMNTPE